MDLSGNMVESPAETVKQFFAFVFTEEDYDNTPEFGSRCETLPFLNNIIITDEIVRKKLYETRADEAGGPDELTPRLLPLCKN